MKIELRISPAHLYLVTPSDKSFLLWKRNLWCIIWFSIWKWPFIVYDSCYSRGAPAPFHFMVGFRIDVVNLKHSVPYESLVVSLFEKPDFTQANYICRYLDLWLLVNRESNFIVHESLVSLASPRFRALPLTTVIIIIQSNRYCSH